jgi:hypothetical protein
MNKFMARGGWALLVVSGAALAQGRGLVPSSATIDLSPWQLRVDLQVAPPRSTPGGPISGLIGSPPDGSASARWRSTRLLGDYYPDSLRLGETDAVRLTSGLLIGQRAGLRDPSALLVTRGNADAGSLAAPVPWSSPDTSTDPVVTWPYLGIGYSGTGLRGNWSIKADIGLAAQRPGAARAGFGRWISGTQNLDDFLRDLRLSPMFQLGVSYAF